MASKEPRGMQAKVVSVGGTSFRRSRPVYCLLVASTSLLASLTHEGEAEMYGRGRRMPIKFLEALLSRLR